MMSLIDDLDGVESVMMSYDEDPVGKRRNMTI